MDKARHEQSGPGIDALRRRLLYGTVILTTLGLLHHADHVIRGNLVVENGLNPDWNHSGWPFQDERSTERVWRFVNEPGWWIGDGDPPALPRL